LKLDKIFQCSPIILWNLYYHEKVPLGHTFTRECFSMNQLKTFVQWAVTHQNFSLTHSKCMAKILIVQLKLYESDLQ